MYYEFLFQNPKLFLSISSTANRMLYVQPQGTFTESDFLGFFSSVYINSVENAHFLLLVFLYDEYVTSSLPWIDDPNERPVLWCIADGTGGQPKVKERHFPTALQGSQQWWSKSFEGEKSFSKKKEESYNIFILTLTSSTQKSKACRYSTLLF